MSEYNSLVVKAGHSNIAAALSDYQGSRPDNLPAGLRKFQNKADSNLWSPCSNCSSSDENNSPTALNSFNWDKPDLEDKSVDFGWSASNHKRKGKAAQSNTSNMKADSSSSGSKLNGYVKLTSMDPQSTALYEMGEPRSESKKEHELVQRCEESFKSLDSKRVEANVDGTISADSSHLELTSPEKERQRREEILKEKEDLKNVAWFQAGIPREIALEVLAEKPEGSFILRDSTTKPGCYALSLRVSCDKNPTGIAHYLILRTTKGYQIKGFTKEFPTLRALITHHSVMPELLPCPLNLSRTSTRDAEQEFEETEVKTPDIFDDIHWLMTELEDNL